MKKRNVMFLTLLLLTLLPLITAYELCEETISEDELEIIEITNPGQNNDTEWSWKPTEETRVEVTIKNENLTTRIFQVELIFLDEDQNEKEIVTEGTDLIKTISLSKNEEETLNFSFQLEEPNQDTYYLYAKLYDTSNESICRSLKATSTSEETTILIEEEEKIVVIRNIDGPKNITAGSEAKYIIEVINLGTTKEDRVLVILYNANLKIREEKEIIELGVSESKTATFNITIPKNATTQEESFLFSAEYDYSNDTGFYYQTANKVKIFSVQIEATENQITQTSGNQTVQINNSTNNSTQNSSTSQNQEQIKTPYTQFLWAIIPLILAILIAIVSFFFLRKRKEYLDTSPPAPSAATNYVKNIQKQSNSPTRPDKPS